MLTRLNIDPNLQIPDRCLQRSLPIAGAVHDFDDGAAAEFLDLVQGAMDLDQPVLPLLISSDGGSIDCLRLMLTYLNQLEIPIATMTADRAYSAGAMLLGFGTVGYRYAAPNSSIMLHRVSANPGYSSANELETISKEVAKSEEKLFEELSKHCGYRSNKLLTMVKNKGGDWYLTPEEAQELKLIDHIGLPSWEVTVSFNVEFKQ